MITQRLKSPNNIWQTSTGAEGKNKNKNKTKSHTICNSKQMNKKQTQGTIIHFYYDILEVIMSRDGRKLKESFLEDTVYKNSCSYSLLIFIVQLPWVVN